MLPTPIMGLGEITHHFNRRYRSQVIVDRSVKLKPCRRGSEPQRESLIRPQIKNTNGAREANLELESCGVLLERTCDIGRRDPPYSIVIRAKPNSYCGSSCGSLLFYLCFSLPMEQLFQESPVSEWFACPRFLGHARSPRSSRSSAGQFRAAGY